MKKEKTVRTYQRRTKSGKMVTVHEHKASYDAAEEARKAAAKKAGAGSELSKKKAVKEESPLGFSADDYKEWYHWDMDSDPKNEAALRVEKALTKKMGKKAYNKYLEDMTNSYTARGHKKAHQALLDEHTASQKKQDAESSKVAKDIARGAKEKSPKTEKSGPKTFTEIPKTSRSIKEGTYDVGNGYSVKVKIDNLGDSKKPALQHRAKLYKDGKEVSAYENSYNEVRGTAKGVHDYLKKVQGWASDEAKRTKRNGASAKRQATIAAKNGKTTTSTLRKRASEMDAHRIATSSFGEKEYKGGGKAGQAALDKFLGTMKPNDKGQYYVSFGIKNVKSRGTKWMSRSDIEKYIRQFGGTSFGSARITAAEPKKKK